MNQKLNFSAVRNELKKHSNSEKANILQRFFKTGKNEYAEGDIFYGIPVPIIRNIVKQFIDMPVYELVKLLQSPIHEERLAALLICVDQFTRSDQNHKYTIAYIYLSNTKYINNWDLVDLSAEKILGPFLEMKNKHVLFTLAKSKSLWERRISILSTFHYIKKGDPIPTIRISKILLHDSHDLIQKAVGWMLREVGKRCDKNILFKFLNRYAPCMPRTMLRYAIEKCTQGERKKYLQMH